MAKQNRTSAKRKRLIQAKENIPKIFQKDM
jgi:hypothetical protein